MAYSGYVFYNKNGFVFANKESELILENVSRVLRTKRGERVNNLAFGSDISRYIFMPQIAVEDLVKEVVNSLQRCEPRVEVLDVSFNADNEREVVNIDLKLLLKESQEVADLTVAI